MSGDWSGFTWANHKRRSDGALPDANLIVAKWLSVFVGRMLWKKLKKLGRMQTAAGLSDKTHKSNITYVTGAMLKDQA